MCIRDSLPTLVCDNKLITADNSCFDSDCDPFGRVSITEFLGNVYHQANSQLHFAGDQAVLAEDEIDSL